MGARVAGCHLVHAEVALRDADDDAQVLWKFARPDSIAPDERLVDRELHQLGPV